MTGVDGRNGSGGEKQCRYAYLCTAIKDMDSVGAVLDWGIDRRAFESPASKEILIFMVIIKKRFYIQHTALTGGKSKLKWQAKVLEWDLEHCFYSSGYCGCTKYSRER
ncbi:hypothetical protein OIU77_005506, partial [Salix suchowensis]